MLTGKAQWKEIIIVTDEDERTFVFTCGWGVTPPVAYVPAEADWQRCVPPWLLDRRPEVIALMESMGHVVHDGPYRDWRPPPTTHPWPTA